MRRLNLLNHKTSPRRLWTKGIYSSLETPEIVMEGSSVQYLDADGYIMPDGVSATRYYRPFGIDDPDEFEETLKEELLAEANTLYLYGK